MRTVEIQLRPDELPGAMGAMRIWLDERRFEPSVFSCHNGGNADSVLLRIDFRVAAEGDAFAERFNGRSLDRLMAAA